jgi:hypothetical protein
MMPNDCFLLPILYWFAFHLLLPTEKIICTFDRDKELSGLFLKLFKRQMKNVLESPTPVVGFNWQSPKLHPQMNISNYCIKRHQLSFTLS